MRSLALACLALGLSASPVRAESISVNAFNNSTLATVSFDDGSGMTGHSGAVTAVLSQFLVTFSGGSGTPITFDTFSIDLFHAVSVGQTYDVTPRGDLATAFTNGSRIAYIFQAFGLEDLTNNAVQAAAVQIALWDLSLNNHNPTFFGMDADGTYSSGDPNVFGVSLGGNPDAAQIAGLVNQYLAASVGATGQGEWLDASAAGDDPNRGQSLLQPVPEPPSIVLSLTAAVCLSAWGLRRVGRQAYSFGAFCRGGDKAEPAVR